MNFVLIRNPILKKFDLFHPKGKNMIVVDDRERPSGICDELTKLMSCIVNRVKFDWSILDGESFRNISCIPSVWAWDFGSGYAPKEINPVGWWSSGAQLPQNTLPMTSIAFRILRHLCIQNTIIKCNLIYDTGHLIFLLKLRDLTSAIILLMIPFLLNEKLQPILSKACRINDCIGKL